MKGLMKKTAAAALALAVSVSSAAVVNAFGGTTEAATPTDKNDAALYWATKCNTDWTDSPGAPLLLDDEIIYTSADKLCALDKDTGEKLEKTGTMAASASYGITAPIYADGMIIVSLAGGVVQAFDAETFESLWVYTDSLGGNTYGSYTELTYSDGYVYTGFWSSETSEANFVCIPIEDTDTTKTDEAQEAAWTYTSAGGFYWACAYCTDDQVIVGTDNGADYDNADAAGSVIVFDKKKSIENKTAEVLSKSTDFVGDLRSGITYDESTGYYFVSSKSQKLYRFKVGEDGKVSDVKALELSGSSTSTPVVANGRIYVGVCGTNAYTEYSGHHIAVIDAESFEIAYTMQTNGYCQSSALVSTQDGGNYVYFTANYTPGKVYAFYDKAGMTEPNETETADNNGTTVENCCPTLFTPVGDQSQYCLASLISDEDGTLYFKNDSGYIMALGSRVDSLEVSGTTLYKEGDKFDTDSLTVTAVMANGTEKDVTSKATYTLSEALTTNDTEIVVAYDGMLYGDTDSKTGYEYGDVYGTLAINVLAEDDYNAVTECIDAIDAIGDVTLESKEAIEAARAAYDALSDDNKKLVTNIDTLTDAEDTLEELENASSSSSSTPGDSSDSDSSSDIDSSSTSSEDSTAGTSSADSSTSGTTSTEDSSAAASTSTSTSSASSSSSSNADDKTSNPATGTTAAASAGIVLLGAVLVVSRKNK